MQRHLKKPRKMVILITVPRLPSPQREGIKGGVNISIKGGRQVSTAKLGLEWHAENARGLVKMLASQVTGSYNYALAA